MISRAAEDNLRHVLRVDALSGKSLVIFGCGYVGTALARAGRAADARVTALTRNQATAEVLRAEGVTVVQADLAGDEWHGRIPSGTDFAVNCVSSGGGGLAGYEHSYLQGMRSIVRWTGQGGAPIGTLLYTSSTSVYPAGGGDAVTETTATAGASPRGAVLRAAEEVLEQAPPAVCARWFILRLAGIYGPGRHHLLDELRSGSPVFSGRGDHRLNLAHRDDIVSAVLACLGAPAAVRNEIFNVADGAPATKHEVVAWLCAQLGRSVPAWADTGGPSHREGAAVPDRTISSRKLQERLGWRPAYPDFRAGYAPLLRQV